MKSIKLVVNLVKKYNLLTNVFIKCHFIIIIKLFNSIKYILMKKQMLIFAIETSCDDTSVCIMGDNRNILSHITHSQNEHSKFGGVVPEIASRSHVTILQKISKMALLEAKVGYEDIDYFCATCGPGLIGSLLVGSTFCKSLSIGADKPFYPINHLEGHLLSTSYNNDVQ